MISSSHHQSNQQAGRQPTAAVRNETNETTCAVRGRRIAAGGWLTAAPGNESGQFDGSSPQCCGPSAAVRSWGWGAAQPAEQEVQTCHRLRLHVAGQPAP